MPYIVKAESNYYTSMRLKVNYCLKFVHKVTLSLKFGSRIYNMTQLRTTPKLFTKGIVPNSNRWFVMLPSDNF